MNSLDSLIVKTTNQLCALQKQVSKKLVHGDPERGETIERILWTVALIGLVGIAVAAITAYVNTQIAKIG